jgi:hypothetical protein
MIFWVGPYRFQLPYWTEVKAKPLVPPEDNFGEGSTLWEFSLGTYSFHIHLDTAQQPEDLGVFILTCTKQYVSLDPVEFNGIRGVRYGSYHEPGGCRIAWWLKKGELMICIELQGPGGLSSDEDMQTHSQIMESLSHVTLPSV